VFTKNLSYEQGALVSVPIRLALNASKATWTVKVQDVVSGREAKQAFEVE